MTRTACGISFLIVMGFAQPGLAQPMIPGGGVQRPSVSPYINLIRGNNGISNAALNYYGIVRPEQQMRQQASAFQQQLAQTNQNIGTLAAGENAGLSVTGKGATFNNYSHYFNTYGNSGGGSFGRGPSGGGGGANISIGVSGGTSGRGAVQAPAGGRGPRR